MDERQFYEMMGKLDRIHDCLKDSIERVKTIEERLLTVEKNNYVLMNKKNGKNGNKTYEDILKAISFFIIGVGAILLALSRFIFK